MGPPDVVVAGGTVLTPAGAVRADVAIAAGRIAGVGPPASFGDAPEIAAAGLLVAPGLVDLQCNGAVGVDLSSEPERLWDVAAALPRWGVTAWLPTIVTGPAEIRRRALAVLRAGPPAGDERPFAAPLGLHFEGPFLAPERRGAHPVDRLVPPDPALPAEEGWSVGVALVTLAPELPGALDLVRSLAGAGIVVSAGHSSATAAETRAALDAGVGYVTHLFNAMVPLGHREPGLPGVALTDPRVRVGVIADGIHVDPAVVALAARALGDRLTLVTDAVAALGAPAGPVRLASQWAEVGDGDGDGAVRLPDGTLAGSTLALDRAVRNLVAFTGVPLADALAAASTTPSATLGRDDRGTIAPGAVADLVLVEADGTLVATVAAGRVAHDTRGEAGPWRS
jgi:N-acetylglucosamine-6-phosphate deacetylase